MQEFNRTRMLLKEEAMNKLSCSHVAIFGVGGVGGNCIESLARSGIGSITIIDHDTVSITNINRQVIALHSTIGKSKVEVMKDRLLDINPLLKVNTMQIFVDKDTMKSIDFTSFDYIVDAIDTVSAKLMLIEKAKELDIPIISCMGTGNKLDPSQLQIMDIMKTNYCPLAKVMRKELKKRGIYKLKVLSSYEKPIQPEASNETSIKRVPGSTSFVPSVAGIIISREVIMDIIEK